MERRLHNEDFEKLLKENADQFKMTPSKKVWHGIYNDLHPGRRWPSVAISFLLLFTLVVIGHLNTNNYYKNSFWSYNLTDDEVSKDDNKTTASKYPRSKSKRTNHSENRNTIAENLSKNNTSGNGENILGSLPDNTLQSILPQNLLADKQAPGNPASKELRGSDVSQSGNENVGSKTGKTDKLDDKGLVINQNTNTELLQNLKAKTQKSLNIVKAPKPKDNKAPEASETKTQEEATAAELSLKLKKSKMNWLYYITPTLSYRIMSGSPIEPSPAMTPAATPYQLNNNDSKSPIHRAAMGVEFGGQVTYELSKKLKFIGGMQLNYSRYTVEANNIHPITASLLLNSDNIDRPYVLTSVSRYGNRTGTAEVALQNYSFQASMPIGLQYKIWGNNTIEISAASTFQPSFVIASKAYLLSTDKRNFISDPSLSRKWNMSTNLGTFISVKASSFTWQIGPQVRYQLLSTFGPNNPAKEHLVDYGVRFGVSKTLK